MFTKNVKGSLRLAKKIVPPTVCSLTASVANSTTIGVGGTYDAGQNFSCTLMCITGTIFLNPLITATTANGFRVDENTTIDIKVENILSLISDSTTATFQAIIWEG